MTQPLVLEYLKTHTLEQLKAEHGVLYRFSKDSSKVSLNYDQLLSKPGDLLAEQCRGMVLSRRLDIDTTDEVYELLAWPMCRFYNSDDQAAAKVDWSDPKLQVQEKLDGTCCIVYFDGKRWCVATRSVPEADIPIFNDHPEIGNATFADLFWQCFESTHWPRAGLNKELTYVFELTGPYNRIVVEYDTPHCALLAMRDTQTGVELDVRELPAFDWNVPKVWALNSAEAVAAFINAHPGQELEGAVVMDSQFRRVKMKSDAWKALQGTTASVANSKRAIVEALLLNKMDDVMPLLSEKTRTKVEELLGKLLTFCGDVDERFQNYKSNASNRKEFAGMVLVNENVSSIFFNLMDKKAPTCLELLEGLAEKKQISSGLYDAILAELER